MMLTLGEVIDELKRAEPESTVQFDFCYTAPTTVASYRGYYNELAIGWQAATYDEESGTYWPLATTVLIRLEEAVGKTFEGYKGGDCKMNRDTTLYVANWGDTGGTVISHIEHEHKTVIFHTKKVD